MGEPIAVVAFPFQLEPCTIWRQTVFVRAYKNVRDGGGRVLSLRFTAGGCRLQERADSALILAPHAAVLHDRRPLQGRLDQNTSK